jgi:LPS sulfotransferase NodH
MNVFILSAIRSGSTYLSNMIWDTKLFHYPEAHSDHPSLVPQRKIREFLAPNPQIDPWSMLASLPDVTTCELNRSNAIAHLRHKCSFIQKQPCLFKILMEQYQYYLLKMSDRALIEELIPDLKYIWLERRDIIARTVSAYLFFKSRVDHVCTQKAYNEYMSRAVEVDEKGLLDVYKNHVKRCDWSEFLSGTDYLKVDYEDLIVQPEVEMKRCIEFLDIPIGAEEIAWIVANQPKFKTERPESIEWQRKLKQMLRKGSV